MDVLKPLATSALGPKTVTAVNPEAGYPVAGLIMWEYRLPLNTTNFS